MHNDGMLQNIAVVSVDMFQTLVNVDSRCHPFWQQVLGENYTQERAAAYWSLLKSFLYGEYRILFANDYRFVRARTVAERSFKKMFAHLGLDLDPAHTAGVFVKEHGLAAPFNDTNAFLQGVGKLFPVCLVSDADEEMIGPLRNLHNFDHIFTSEQVGAYKNSPGGELFRSVAEHYGLAAEQILHIGDSPFDVLGAGRAGFITCWLNRFERMWEYEFQPYRVVASLWEAAALLGAG
ncbi:MAG: HAD family hydrolase [Bacillota bacterium]